MIERIPEDINLLRRITGDERLDHYFVAVNVNVGCTWRVRECERKVKITKARKWERCSDRRSMRKSSAFGVLE